MWHRTGAVRSAGRTSLPLVLTASSVGLLSTEYHLGIQTSNLGALKTTFRELQGLWLIKITVHFLNDPLSAYGWVEEASLPQKRYEGEEWAASTHHLVSGLWDEFEMSDDMDLFEEECEQKENLIRLQAKSPLPSGEYFVPDKYFLETALGLIEEIKYKEMNHKDAGYVYEGPTWEEAVLERAKTRAEGGCPWFSDIVYYQGGRTPILPPGVWGTPLLDDQDRVCTIVDIKKKGHKFCLAESPFGDVYVDLKFTAYIPDVGDSCVMVIKKKSLGKNAPFVCKRIV